MDVDMFMLAMGIGLTAIGIAELSWGIDKDNLVLRILGGLVTIAGLIFIVYSMWQAQKDKKAELKEKAERDKKRGEQHNHLMAVLEAIANKIGADVDKVNKE